MRMGLPAWVYRDRHFYELEVARVLLPAWQIVCHESDLPHPGDYQRFDFLGRPIVVIRDDDGELQALYNVCRHRAARLLDGDEATGRGRCPRTRIVCPYHGWTYALDGRLLGVPRAHAYGIDLSEWGLHRPELEIWHGFVFVRCVPGGPTLADTLRPWDEALRAYRIPEMRALGRVTHRRRDVNWKTIVDNYGDGLHIDVAHRGLSGLCGRSYSLDADAAVMHMQATVDDRPGTTWSGRLYCKTLPTQRHLPETLQRRWQYLLLWPNLALDIYPDQVDFMQMIPLGPGATLIREIPYGLPEPGRELRLARYLNWRINRVVNHEDRGLIDRVQAGMNSGIFGQGPLSKDEVCLHAMAECLRRRIPEACMAQPPWQEVPDADA
jgi:phenylpropionate dioxygenase-like ring-hydroxylating dioxygenase large terminal subunit